MKLNKSIPKFDIHNPIHDFFDHGISPDEIKQQIVKALSPYFHSQKVLEENAINRLVSIWILLVRFRSSKDDLGSFEEIIKITDEMYNSNRGRGIHFNLNNKIPLIIHDPPLTIQ